MDFCPFGVDWADCQVGRLGFDVEVSIGGLLVVTVIGVGFKQGLGFQLWPVRGLEEDWEDEDKASLPHGNVGVQALADNYQEGVIAFIFG